MDAGTIPAGFLSDTIQGHQQELDSYVWRQDGVLVEPEDAIRKTDGTITVWPQQLEYGSTRRSTKVARGDGTPRRNSRAETRQYWCEEYRVSDPIDDLSQQEMDNSLDVVEKRITGCGHEVHADVESDLADILKGNGSADENDLISTKSLSSGEEFDNDDSDPDGVIQDMTKSTRGNLCIAGENVVRALLQHPQWTGSDAGSGDTMLGFDQFRNRMRTKHGVEVIIAQHLQQEGSVEFELDRVGIMDDVFAITRVGNLYKVMFEEPWQDDYPDDDSRENLVRYGVTMDIIVGFEDNAMGIDQNVLS